MLADEKAYALILEEGDLAGLPDFARSAAKAAAEERGHKGKYAITLARSSVESFLQFSARRDLREKVFAAWIARGESGGATDNRAIVAEMVELRAERAQLLGFKTFADYRLDDQMAKTPGQCPQAARRGLGRARGPAPGARRTSCRSWSRPRAATSRWLTWDWRYYAEKLRKARYDLDEASVKPYLALDNMIAAAFETATPAVRPDVQAGRRCRSITRMPAPGR